ncbi:unnamed protein product [Rhizophagus irregularis]|uniref:Uncharacterized protein n=1 Tax=Rhizophagus irregularis TaxID=588596 RepID=A0A2I1FKL0_9GLOM|nr:hypothetical protein RhiirB3_455091 [Rhizophagus irregularis]CAB5393880.1 unnamed protein product [Rhizophagus irregularis]
MSTKIGSFLLDINNMGSVPGPDQFSDLGPKTVKTGPKTDAGPVFARTDPTYPAVIQESSQIDIESSYSKEELPPKRQKLRHVIATSNVSSDIALMEDFFDTMSEEEIFRYKAKQILT